jgi:ATP-binding cassette, subfamily B, bacterial
MDMLHAVFKHYSPHLYRWRWWVVLHMSCLLLYILQSTVIGPLAMKHIVDGLSGGVTPETLIEVRAYFFIFAVNVVIYALIVRRLATYCQSTIESHIMRDIATATFTSLPTQSYGFFSSRFSGSLVNQSRKFSASFENIYSYLTENTMLIVEVSAICIVLYTILPLLSGILIVWIVCFLLLVRALVVRQMPIEKERAASSTTATGMLSDALSNILTVKLFASETYESERIAQSYEREHSARLRSWYGQNKRSFIQALATVSLNLGLMGTGIYLWSIGHVTAGTVIIIHTYSSRIIERLWSFGKETSRFFSTLTDAAEMAQILDKQPDIQDAVAATFLTSSSHAIHFKDVTCAYGDSAPVLKNLTLHIPAGQRIGFVGHSGAGKTTMTKLLLRFIEPTTGTITIGDQNIGTVTQQSLREHIGYVPQDTSLFHRSLSENIRYGNPAATQGSIEEAARKARAHDFIQKLPKGYDTLVGERGLKLSGGERQRITIARAILKNAPILVLDEATSALDSESEVLIQEALGEAMKGKTSIVIAHRLSTITKLDRIVVFDQGAIVEDGTHDTLIQKGGIYADLWKHQSGGFVA